MKKAVILSCVVGLLGSCTERIDDSARYVFRGETTMSYLEKHADTYSSYVNLLKVTPVSTVSKTTVSQLLSARGNYTVFAPTNQAIQTYLDSLAERADYLTAPSFDAFTDSVKLDSIRKVIVYNSIIDSGDEEKCFEIARFPTKSGSEITLDNLNAHKLNVTYSLYSDSIFINRNCPIDMLNRDIPASNGVIHQMIKVIAPDDITASVYLHRILDTQEEGYLVMARAIQACGLLDTLNAIRDEKYEIMYQTGQIPDFPHMEWRGFADTGTAHAPAHRKYGFTIFAEPDDFWREQGIDPKDPNLLQKLQQWVKDQHKYSDEDCFTIDNDYWRNTDNLLYQWVTYHILPMRLVADRLVIHHNESGFSYDRPSELGIPVSEYYVPMGPRRLIKLIEGKETNGVFINRFPILANGRKENGHEIGCLPEKVGSRVGNDDDRAVISDLVNACIYPITAPIAYTDDIRDNLKKERLRLDAMGIFPEAMNNDIRKCPSTAEEHQYVYIPPTSLYQYFDDLLMNDQTNMVYFNAYKYGWPGKNGDEMKGVGRYEVTYRLPPVPRSGTYEIRYGLIATDKRGVAQVYFGDNLDYMPVVGIPMDWTIAPADQGTGWEADTDDQDYNAEIDKRMRNNGYMNGPRSECVSGNVGSSLREYTWAFRRILLRQYMEPNKVYYIRMKSVLESDAKEFYMDYMELCSKEIYDNPETPEDIW